MKKFIISVLCTAVFFIGLGGLIENAGARFKSDERALSLIKQARTALGGEAALNNVQSLSIAANVSKTFDFDGSQRIEQGELEINLQMPNQFGKTLKFRRDDGAGVSESKEIKKDVRVVLMNQSEGATFKASAADGEKPNVVILRKGDGDKAGFGEKTVDGKTVRVLKDENVEFLRGGGNFHQNELFRTTLALLLAAPQGVDAEFVYAGEGDVDGNRCDIIEARTGGSTVKLYLDKSSHLPRMMSYQGHQPMIFKIKKGEAATEGDVQIFERKMDKPATAEFQVRFSDYRTVGGVQLPHRWTQTVGGNADETIDVTGYEINPANIAEKFQNLPPKVLIRTNSKIQ